MFDIGQLAVKPGAQALYGYGVIERRGSQQLDADMVGEHVSERQAQLSIAIERRFGAGNLGTVQADFTAVFVGLDVGCTGANDEVARLVGVRRDRGCEGKRGKRCA